MTDEGTIATSTPEEETPATAPATEAPAAPETPAETPPPAPDTSVGAEVATDVNKAEDESLVNGTIAHFKGVIENLLPEFRLRVRSPESLLPKRQSGTKKASK